MVSVVVPVFNDEGTIRETLESVKEQTYSEWECAVVDDGSSDSSLSIAEAYQENDNRFRIIRRERQPKGANTCRNMGLEAAQGDYLLFLDADDLLAPHCLETRLAVARENPGNDFWLFHTGRFIKKPGDIPYDHRYDGTDPLHLFLQNKMIWQSMAALWRKEAIQNLGGFNEAYQRMQDVELYSRAFFKLDNYYLHDGPEDAYYRVNPAKYESSEFMKRSLESLAMYIPDMVRLAPKKELDNVRSSLRKNYRQRVRQVYHRLQNMRGEARALVKVARESGVIGYRDYFLLTWVVLFRINRVFGLRGLFYRLI